MKRCPTCQRTYTDDSLSFCLQDGAQLVRINEPTHSDPNATLILEGGGVDQPAIPPTVLAGGRETSETTKPSATIPNTGGPISQTQPPAKTQSTVTVVALTAIATILLLGLGGAGAWLLLRDKSDNKNGETNTARVVDSQNNASPSSSSNRNGAKTNVTPSPAASVAPVDVAAARKEVTSTLNAWAESIKSRDINAHMKYYAATLNTYYARSNVSADVVRADRERAFSKYSTLDIQISNLNIEIDPNGQRAVATFEKTFDFRGDKNFSGSGPNRFWFEKTGGVWRITGEKDLTN